MTSSSLVSALPKCDDLGSTNAHRMSQTWERFLLAHEHPFSTQSGPLSRTCLGGSFWVRWGQEGDVELLGPRSSEDLRRGSWWDISLERLPPGCLDSKSPPTSMALLWLQVRRRDNVTGPAWVRCPSLVLSALVGAAGCPTSGSWEDAQEREVPVSWHHYGCLGHLASPLMSSIPGS